MKKRYKSYKKLIYNLCYKWSKKTNFDFDFLLSEANFIYMTALKKHDPLRKNGCCFSTYLYISIINRFQTIQTQQTKKQKDIIFIPCENVCSKSEFDYIPRTKTTSEDYTIRKTLFESLSNEAAQVVNLILNCPKESIDAMTTPIKKKFQKKKILAYCKKKFNFNSIEIKKIERELTRLVNDF